ncbi:TetR/AcrR family transcriptional regulator [Mycolicibacter longobardus]|uniref:Transcriptional regulator n=1 Tax=Mycolicibacter longobardus TaxID=1108812 RepID=A0A1X1YIS6_9MYCO|nr:TetR/AcrR family transcriptional regulator [Mycolicibacter longobardus]MCV7384919.1 TetR/AcrR family transcriptional regulator [Mycolicibacter longobardus]ORW10923.1 transcriptional regulator [Mycolicibacter longobardus]
MSEDTARPLRKDAERNRKRVLEAARELFASKGLEPNLNDVAHHAGVGVGTVYRRFATKEELFEAIFEDGLNQLADLAETALQQPDSWQAIVWYVEHMCEITATDRGLREIAFSKAYGGDRVKTAQERLVPLTKRLVERAQRDGYLRPGLSSTDMPIFALLAGTVSEFAGNIDPELWRRYVAIILDGIRHRSGQTPLPVAALDDDGVECAMRSWEPAGPCSDRLSQAAGDEHESGDRRRV